MKIRFFTPADNQPPKEPPVWEPGSKNKYVPYSATELKFIVDNYQTMTTEEIAAALGRTKSGVQSLASDLKLRKSPEAKLMAARKAWQKRVDAYTRQELTFLIDNWQTMTIAQMAQALGRTYSSVKSQGQKKMKLKKTPEAISALSRRFNAGQFKKGQLPANTIEGEEMVIRTRYNYKKKTSKQYIRSGLGKWQELKHHVWEQVHGPVPKGMILTFIKGQECRLDNLELISMQENARRNSASLNLPDGYVAHLLAVRKPEQRAELLKQPELLDLKRTQIHLKRTIKAHEHPKPAKTRRSAKSHGR